MNARRNEPPHHVEENIDAILDFYRREEASISGSQRVLERVGRLLGRPAFLFLTLVFVGAWIAAQVSGWLDFDPPPFFWLQGLVSLGALLMATVILITQNRQGSMEALHAHLDLQVNLLTEQKASKLIELMEELRRDLPMVTDRRDQAAEALQEPVDPHDMLQALDEKRVGAKLAGDRPRAK